MKPGTLAGNDALAIMVEEIGNAVGRRRMREFEGKVRAKMAGQTDRSANDWITAMAEIIVADDDTRADAGFQRGVKRIRLMAAQRTVH